MRPRPVLSLLFVLLAYALAGDVDWKGSEVSQTPAVTHNERFK